MPPAAASNGTAAWRFDASAPPGRVASTISFAASAKKNTMPTSLTRACVASANVEYERGNAFAHTSAIAAPATSSSERSTMYAIGRRMPLHGEALNVEEVGVRAAQI